MVFISHIKKKYKYSFTFRNIDNKISIRKIRNEIKDNSVTDPLLLKNLKILILMDRVSVIIMYIVLVTFFSFTITSIFIR